MCGLKPVRLTDRRVIKHREAYSASEVKTTMLKCPVCDKQYVEKEEFENNAMIVHNHDKGGTSRMNDKTVSTGVSEVHVKSNMYTGGVELYFHE